MRNFRWVSLSVLIVLIIGLAAASGYAGSARAQDDNDPGQVVYASDRSGNYEIYVLDPKTGLTTQLTNNAVVDVDPMWSPDGSMIVFASDRDGDFELYVMRADGSDLRQLTNNITDERQPVWQPGGAFIVFTSDMNGPWDLYAISADGAIIRQLTNDAFDERGLVGIDEGEVVPGPGSTGPTPAVVTATPAPAALPDGTVDARELNVRQNPGEGATIMTVAPRDTPFQIVGRRADNTWIQVQLLDGRIGWVFTELVQVNIDLFAVPVVNAPYIPAPPTATPTFTPVPYTATPVPVTISFGVNNTTITAGECVTLTWFVEGIKAVFYQGEGVVGAGSKQECPDTTSTYKLTVIRQDDTVVERSITVTVNPAP